MAPMSPSSSSPSSSSNGGLASGTVTLLVAAVAIGAGTIVAAASYRHHLLAPRGGEENHSDEDEGEESSRSSSSKKDATAAATIERLTDLRSAERRGRIRAEIKLRDALREMERMRLARAAGEEDDDGAAAVALGDEVGEKPCDPDRYDSDVADTMMMTLRCIGVMRTPFPKRMGTPRQGALVPHSRGYLQLFPRRCPPECLHGIDSYSHLWVIFGFHANTDLPSKNHQNRNRRKTKIRPPRAPRGVRVGQLATRSPHRPNPLGLSLVKIEKFDHKSKRLHVSALDLVDGTPVYDVKPFVPWDVPGHQYHCDDDSTTADGLQLGESLRVPPWVSGRDDVVDLDHVTFDTEAEIELRRLVVDRGKLEPLYSGPEGYEMAVEAIREVLAQDPRASHRRGTVTSHTGKEGESREGEVEGEDEDEPYRFVFGRVRVEFVVRRKMRRRRRSRGDEDNGDDDGHVAVVDPSSSSPQQNGDVVVVVTGVAGVDFETSGGGAGGRVASAAAGGVPLAEDIVADDE